jgi:hypothetical protein
VVGTNITGTIQRIGNDMRRRNAGRILITGSIAGFIPGSFQGRLLRHLFLDSVVTIGSAAGLQD